MLSFLGHSELLISSEQNNQTMRVSPPMKVVYVPQTIPVRKKAYRSPVYLTRRSNQVVPRPLFTCIDEIYSTPAASYPLFQHTYVPLNSSSQESKHNKNSNYRKWLFAIVIIIIIICIITIIVLLAVFLTRPN